MEKLGEGFDQSPSQFATIHRSVARPALSRFHACEPIVVTVSRQSFFAIQESGPLRTHDTKHEIDIIVETAGRRLVAIEVKLAGVASDRDVKHLNWLHAQLGDRSQTGCASPPAPMPIVAQTESQSSPSPCWGHRTGPPLGSHDRDLRPVGDPSGMPSSLGADIRIVRCCLLRPDPTGLP